MTAKRLPLLVLLAAGCQPAAPPPPAPTPVTAASDDADDHDHGRTARGGTVFDLGKWHAEFLVDHGKQQATVFILSGNLKQPVPIAAGALTLTLKEPPLTVELKAVPQETDGAGKASRFVGTHPAFGKGQEFAGTVTGTVDGKAVTGRFAESDHDHKH